MTEQNSQTDSLAQSQNEAQNQAQDLTQNQTSNETRGSSPSGTSSPEAFEASISMLFMSIGSSAAMSLGLSPHPQTGETKIDKEMARFNIDLLLILKEKTKGNLNKEETQFLEAILGDLQLKFIALK